MSTTGCHFQWIVNEHRNMSGCGVVGISLIDDCEEIHAQNFGKHFEEGIKTSLVVFAKN